QMVEIDHNKSFDCIHTKLISMKYKNPTELINKITPLITFISVITFDIIHVGPRFRKIHIKLKYWIQYAILENSKFINKLKEFFQNRSGYSSIIHVIINNWEYRFVIVIVIFVSL